MSYYHVSYCIGNLQIPSYSLPWEDSLFEYPTNLASPLRIIVEASNGASDYGKRYCYYLVMLVRDMMMMVMMMIIIIILMAIMIL